ncbi:hypothetical protein D9611_014228 [Ephemerocybe angulata]|uniref:Uncharacterized protein n=1 Tax=Ephemerocybe angulata TaxID=980116 RepID=A0A8H5EZR3_9AGAR|nr:hypothetical protein D9611_014228 [Tulosesus angulatus]
MPVVAANAHDVLVKKVVVPAHVVRTSASKPDLTIILPRPSCRLRNVHWRAYVTGIHGARATGRCHRLGSGMTAMLWPSERVGWVYSHGIARALWQASGHVVECWAARRGGGGSRILRCTWAFRSQWCARIESGCREVFEIYCESFELWKMSDYPPLVAQIRIAQAQRDWVPSIGLADGSVLTQNAVAWLSPSPIVIVLGEAGIWVVVWA